MYHRTLKDRRQAAKHINKLPTETDQSGAAQTDLNIIVNQFLKTGTSSSVGIPRYADYTQIPTDLREAIEQARSVTRLRQELPLALQNMPVEELLALTPDAIAAILQPPEPTHTPTNEAPKT